MTMCSTNNNNNNMHTARERGVLVLLLFGIIHSTLSQQNMNGSGGLSQDIETLLSAIQEASSVEDENHPFHSLTPTTPSPENINCYVEIVPPMRVGGMCKRMGRPGRRRGRGGRRRMPPTWACQAGVHLEIGSPHCGSQTPSRRPREG